MITFSAKIYIIGINPYVLLPDLVLEEIFVQADKNSGPIPVKVFFGESGFLQTLVKYSGKWRLYLNGEMRKAAGKDVGDTVKIQIGFDTEERITPMPPKLKLALENNQKAKAVFENLSTSRRKEIMRYINNLKSVESVDRNILRAMQFLLGNARFVGRDKP
jgi:hypothetical protein